MAGRCVWRKACSSNCDIPGRWRSQFSQGTDVFMHMHAFCRDAPVENRHRAMPATIRVRSVGQCILQHARSPRPVHTLGLQSVFFSFCLSLYRHLHYQSVSKCVYDHPLTRSCLLSSLYYRVCQSTRSCLSPLLQGDCKVRQPTYIKTGTMPGTSLHLPLLKVRMTRMLPPQLGRWPAPLRPHVMLLNQLRTATTLPAHDVRTTSQYSGLDPETAKDIPRPTMGPQHQTTVLATTRARSHLRSSRPLHIHNHPDQALLSRPAIRRHACQCQAHLASTDLMCFCR